MSLQEKRVQTLSKGLSSAATRLARDVTPKYVHRLRTTIRRIESLAAYARPGLGRKQKRALEDVAALRKRAGKVRDLDVQMGLLGAIANTSTGSDRRVLMELLKRKRNRQAERLRAAVRKVRRSKLLSHIERIAEKAVAASAERPQAPLVEAHRQRASLAAEFASHPSIKHRFLHRVRIKIKMVRYLAESGEETAEQERFVSEMKSVQDALGAWHDWEELAFTAEKQFGHRVNCPLLVEVRALFAAKYSAATAAVAQLFSADSPAPARKQPQSAGSALALAQRA